MSDVTYELNEFIICKSSLRNEPFGYPAKIIEIKVVNEEKWYLVHYAGWNVRHDIWIMDANVSTMFFKHTPEVEAAHKKLFEESKAMTVKKKDTLMGQSKKREGSAGTKPSSVPKIGKDIMEKKLTIIRERSTGSSYNRCASRQSMTDELIIHFPDKLRSLLLDDAELMKTHCMLCKLPARYTVDLIIKEYGEAVSANGEIVDIAGKDENKHLELVLNKHDLVQSSIGILDYFNILLGSRLLYSCEKRQYENFCMNPSAGSPGRKVDDQETPELESIKIVPSSIYGIVHLVRLLVQLGLLIDQSGFGGKSIKILHEHVSNFMIFLSKNVPRYLDIEKDYDGADFEIPMEENPE
ncbi:hypothetical protein PRIPAC_73769 [Pristionchus pacificus]|uniref:MRG domain-containing protein n=1 Tax=Pristionchus pacificus TaxID=54126 RepID=A0A2A6CFH2_PRIPA|nr:hypothetical protein PRIPAC_73769 [Pristionchus pacificus]|eukprot:PDM76803.1 hypothetical protein PRIPAC_42198 [Pristionchus pacificus]